MRGNGEAMNMGRDTVSSGTDLVEVAAMRTVVLASAGRRAAAEIEDIADGVAVAGPRGWRGCRGDGTA